MPTVERGEIIKNDSPESSNSQNSKQISSQKKKITVHLKAVGDAPILKQKNWDVEPTKTVDI